MSDPFQRIFGIEVVRSPWMPKDRAMLVGVCPVCNGTGRDLVHPMDACPECLGSKQSIRFVRLDEEKAE